MKKRFFVIGIAVLMFVGCGKKAEKINIAGYEKYQDQYFRMQFSYPKDWQVFPEPERISIYSSPEMVNRFLDYAPQGKDGARIVVTFQKMDTLKALDNVVHLLQSELSTNGFDISEVKAQALGNAPGTLVHYSGVLARNARVEAMQVAAVKDSFTYTVKYEAFNDQFQSCKSAFDTLLATIKLPEQVSKTTPEDQSKPSQTFVPFENNFIKITHPDNFNPEFPKPKPPAEFSMDVKGYRQDSFVHVDIMPAKGLSLDKVVEQNAKMFKETSRGEGKIDGLRAVYLNYSPMNNIQSRVYFMVKNDKIYRIIMNFYSPMKADYLPAFEKIVNSMASK